MSNIKGIRFPGRYLQGPGCLARLGQEAAAFAEAALVLVDAGIFAQLEPALAQALNGRLRTQVLRHGGECSQAEIDRVSAQGREAAVGVVVGVGGGKALDTAKAVADALKVPVIVVPTIAASDAPCSALAVIYTEAGAVVQARFFPRNPDLVLVDTALIARAPARFLSAGIGDALATWYEADACRRSQANNCMGMPGLETAHLIARACRDTIFEFGQAALIECEAGQSGPALERVVEANILLSGVGFESGGVAAAHGVHDGLCELDEVHHCLHGEKVAIGVLACLKLEGQEAEFERVRAFCAAVRLPTRLADLGVTHPTPEQLMRVAERACRPGEIIHNEPMPVTPAQVVAALQALA